MLLVAAGLTVQGPLVVDGMGPQGHDSDPQHPPFIVGVFTDGADTSILDVLHENVTCTLHALLVSVVGIHSLSEYHQNLPPCNNVLNAELLSGATLELPLI